MWYVPSHELCHTAVGKDFFWTGSIFVAHTLGVQGLGAESSQYFCNLKSCLTFLFDLMHLVLFSPRILHCQQISRAQFA